MDNGVLSNLIKKTVLILIFFILCVEPSFSKGIKDSLKGCDFYFLLIMSSGDCPKCINITLDNIDCVQKEFPKNEFVFVILLLCDREVELKNFKRKNIEFKNVMMFKPEYIEELNIKKDSRLILLDKNQNTIKQYNIYEISYKKICKEIINLIK